MTQDEIGWHWDKDYALEGSGVNVHPQLGTVTYFCDNGAPTVVVNRPTNVQCDFGCGDIGVCGAVTECVVSWPEWGKQITFDGKFLHGAPAELARGSARKEKRVTFLVNVWLNHKPVTAEPLSADELSAMKHKTWTKRQVGWGLRSNLEQSRCARWKTTRCTHRDRSISISGMPVERERSN